MRVSDIEVQKVLSHPSQGLVQEIVGIEETRLREQDKTLIGDLTAEVAAMSDRDELVEELRARIAAGTYCPSAEAITEGMIRRAIVDQIR